MVSSAPLPRKRPTNFLSPNLQSRGAGPSTRRLFPTLPRVHRRPSPQNRATRLGATRPARQPPPPRETPCRNSVAQSPIEERWHVHKATSSDVAPRPSPPIAAELRHAAGRNPPIPPTPHPSGSALPRFCRSISKPGPFPRPQGGPTAFQLPVLP